MSLRSRRNLRFAASLRWALGAACLAWPASAAPTVSLHDAILAAWARAPQLQATEARGREALARAGAARSLVPNAPFATATYFNDRLGSNQKYITYQGELGTPVWLPGEGTATERVAQADFAQVEAEIAVQKLDLAQQVADAAISLAYAANAADVARRRLDTSRRLERDLDHRVQLGEAAQSDALSASADAATAAANLADAEAQAAQSRAVFAALTGMDARQVAIAPTAEAVVATLADDEALDKHPRVFAAVQARRAAEAALQLVRIANRDDPEVSLQGIHEKQGSGTPYDTRFGIVVRFPFSSDARNIPRIAAADTQVTAAVTQLVAARRQVRAAIAQGQAAISGARLSAAASAKAASALDTRAGQIDRAWRAGEMPLIEAERARAAAYDAELARDKAQVAVQAARVRLLLAAGQLP